MYTYRATTAHVSEQHPCVDFQFVFGSLFFSSYRRLLRSFPRFFLSNCIFPLHKEEEGGEEESSKDWDERRRREIFI